MQLSNPMNIRNGIAAEVGIQVSEILLQVFKSIALRPIVRVLLQPAYPHIAILVVDKLLGFHSITSYSLLSTYYTRVRIPFSRDNYKA